MDKDKKYTVTEMVQKLLKFVCTVCEKESATSAELEAMTEGVKCRKVVSVLDKNKEIWELLYEPLVDFVVRISNNSQATASELYAMTEVAKILIGLRPYNVFSSTLNCIDKK